MSWVPIHLGFLPGHFPNCSPRKKNPKRRQQPRWATQTLVLLGTRKSAVFCGTRGRDEGVAQRRSLRNLHSGPFRDLAKHKSLQCEARLHRSSTEQLLEQWKQNRDPRSGQVLEEVPFPNCWSEEAQKGHALRTGTMPESSGPPGLVPRTAAAASRVNLLEVPVFWPQPGQGIWNPRGGIQHFVDQVKVYKEIEKYF